MLELLEVRPLTGNIAFEIFVEGDALRLVKAGTGSLHSAQPGEYGIGHGGHLASADALLQFLETISIDVFVYVIVSLTAQADRSTVAAISILSKSAISTVPRSTRYPVSIRRTISTPVSPASTPYRPLSAVRSCRSFRARV